MKNLAVKLLALQKQALAITKDQENPFYHFAYFDINKLLEVIKPVLSAQGLVLVQPLSNVNGRPAIKTILFDTESGESLEEIYTLPDLQDSQKMGAAITYARRYSIVSLCSLESVCDDGNSAVIVPVKTSVAKPPLKTYNGELDVNELPFGDKEVCIVCNSELTPGKNGKPYCKPCFIKWAAINKPK